MSKFENDLKAFTEKVRQRQRDIFVGCALEVQRSVVEGSEITGAPGQPVDTGNLSGSWVPEFTGPHTWRTSTNVEYAPYVEDNVNNVQFKNHGPHSVAMTIAGWSRIVSAVVQRVVQ